MIIGATTANDSPYLVNDPDDQEGHSDDDCDTQHSDDNCDTQHSDDYCDTQSGYDGRSSQGDVNELMTMTSMKYLLLHWMYQGQEPWMPSIFPIFGGSSMRMQRGCWM